MFVTRCVSGLNFLVFLRFSSQEFQVLGSRLKQITETNEWKFAVSRLNYREPCGTWRGLGQGPACCHGEKTPTRVALPSDECCQAGLLRSPMKTR